MAPRTDRWASEMTPYLLSVTLHVLAALLWLGGMFFLAAVGAPVLRTVEPPELRQELFRRLGQGFRTVGWVAIGVLLLTGLANLHLRGILRVEQLTSLDFWRTPYGRTLAWKVSLVATMLALQAWHDFVAGPRASRLPAGSADALTIRKRAAWAARLSALLGVALVYVAVRLARGG